MLGAIIGDIVGSRFEFNNHRSTDFELFHKDCSFTDDTICTVAVADWLMNPDSFWLTDTMRDWCRKYPNPAGGYGGSFRQWVFSDSGPYNSFGNGAAMRVSPVGWWSEDANRVYFLAGRSAEITHDHPEGIKAAQCIAESIRRLRNGETKEKIKWFLNPFYNLNQTCDQIRKTNSFDETCQVTVPQAIVCFLESTDFESAIRLAVSIGGDSDTIAAITGSLAEAHYGIPDWMKAKAMTYLPEDMKQVVNRFLEVTQNKALHNEQIR
jgi:ADP-ribosyl-[dinitrogen reductase] hydrolase